MRKLFETKLYRRNLIKGINAWAVSLVRYSGPYLKWTRTSTNRPESKKTNDNASQRWQRETISVKKKRMTERDYICQEKKGGRGFTSTEDNVDASIKWLKNNIKKKERLIKATRNNTNNTKINRITITKTNNKKKVNCMDSSSDKQNLA